MAYNGGLGIQPDNYVKSYMNQVRNMSGNPEKVMGFYLSGGELNTQLKETIKGRSGQQIAPLFEVAIQEFMYDSEKALAFHDAAKFCRSAACKEVPPERLENILNRNIK